MRGMDDVAPDASVAWTAMNPDDRPINFTIPLGTKTKDNEPDILLVR